MWMLDDGPLGLLAQVVTATAHWTDGVLYVPESVADAAAMDRTGRRTRLLAQRAKGARLIGVESIEASSEAWNMLFKHLRARAADATADFGEHEAIAICACNRADLVFVTHDKTAAMLALSELGSGRVASPFDLWEDLARRGFVDPAERDVLRSRTLRSDSKMPGVPWRLREKP